MDQNDEHILAYKLNDVDLQLEYYHYLISCLEKKQIAESVSKITKIEKSRGEVKFVVEFEEAMNMKPRSFT